jgi:hypothetical protein
MQIRVISSGGSRVDRWSVVMRQRTHVKRILPFSLPLSESEEDVGQEQSGRG